MTNLVTDPVCGMQVEGTKNAFEYKGANYAFCSPHCRKKFSEHPDQYVLAVAGDKSKGGCCS